MINIWIFIKSHLLLPNIFLGYYVSWIVISFPTFGPINVYVLFKNVSSFLKVGILYNELV